MKPFRAALPALLVVTGIAGGARALPDSFDTDLGSPQVSPRAIVGFAHHVDPATIDRLAAAGITHAAVLDSIDAAIVLGPLDSYRRIAAWGDVRYVDADGRIRLDNYGAKRDTKVTAVRAGAKPLKRRYTGAGVTVAVVDSGIYGQHPDFAGRIARNVNFEPAWFMDAIQDGEYTDGFAEATGNGVDSIGHGTHVAGIVGGSGAAGQGEDFSGVAPGVTFVNLKVADAYEGLLYDVGFETNALLAYEWMLKHRKDAAFPGGIRIATNSWSTIEADDQFEPSVLMVQAAHRAGIVNVFSAGNGGPDPNTVGHGPNRAREVISVAAACKTHGYVQTDTCQAGTIADFSARGPQVDVTAPGVSIFSAAAPSVVLPLGRGALPPPGQANPPQTANNMMFYVALSGTSMSAPHVAGIAALMIEANPRLTPSQVEAILIKTSRDRGAKGKDTAFGYGLVDAHAAVIAATAKPKRAVRR